jgi:hypothetical protein
MRTVEHLPIERDTLTLAELAEKLGISMTIAYERAAIDALPVPRIPGTGRQYRYSRRLFHRLMETGRLDDNAA